MKHINYLKHNIDIFHWTFWRHVPQSTETLYFQQITNKTIFIDIFYADLKKIEYLKVLSQHYSPNLHLQIKLSNNYKIPNYLAMNLQATLFCKFYSLFNLKPFVSTKSMEKVYDSEYNNCFLSIHIFVTISDKKNSLQVTHKLN